MILRKRIIHRKKGPSNSAEGLSIFIESASIFPDVASISTEAYSASPDAWAERTAQGATLVAFRAVGGSPTNLIPLLFFLFFHETPQTLTFSLAKR